MGKKPQTLLIPLYSTTILHDKWMPETPNLHEPYIKTHVSVSCGLRKQGMHKWSEYIDSKNKIAIFRQT